mmetsp:Transcript_36328/g.104597  ORF Transcript_36328/g.104597 Transcript_36328/m.104597 type:complete len:299 (+) Transcript_36328:96-992(+)
MGDDSRGWPGAALALLAGRWTHDTRAPSPSVRVEDHLKLVDLRLDKVPATDSQESRHEVQRAEVRRRREGDAEADAAHDKTAHPPSFDDGLGGVVLPEAGDLGGELAHGHRHVGEDHPGLVPVRARRVDAHVAPLLPAGVVGVCAPLAEFDALRGAERAGHAHAGAAAPGLAEVRAPMEGVACDRVVGHVHLDAGGVQAMLQQLLADPAPTHKIPDAVCVLLAAVLVAAAALRRLHHRQGLDARHVAALELAVQCAQHPRVVYEDILRHSVQLLQEKRCPDAVDVLGAVKGARRGVEV